MPSIVFKKTFKDKEHSVRNEKGLSFHGTSVTKALIGHVNDALLTLPVVTEHGDNKPLQFQWNGKHWYAKMNHAFQKTHEEDAVAEVLDVMQAMGWKFQFQYDTEFTSEKIFGSDTETSNELWVFHKEPECYQVFKETADMKVGIGCRKDDTSGLIYVSSVAPGSIFESTGIQVGAPILSINGVPCKGKQLTEAVRLITSKAGPVKVMTYY
ncbi:expressed unknown protein [Seminavis robusta]|uniref:PDZ domain-containing protein n=1 Tax=Seminavis robusta TaxID=568900 RepID=A0A9N8HKC5_9STRA|nr:expressed unknown protein [Seminavis robusta]|eukprot:Sro747_g196490.1 n/a (211) ;mRNA; r:11680-12312